MKRLFALVVCAAIAAIPALGQVSTVNELAQMDAELEPGGDYSGASLPGTNFRDVQLARAIFFGSDLRGSIFSRSDLQGADFSEAVLRGAIFRESDLSGCNFTGADLSGAVVLGASLAGADLTGAGIDGASFVDIRLSSTGGSHVPALAHALKQATGTDLSRAWIAAATGDAFAFTYNIELPGHWPMRPYYHHPVLAAGRILDVDVQTFLRQAAVEALPGALSAGKVCMLALSAPDSPVFADYPDAIWTLARQPEDTADASITVTMPPLGSQQLARQALLARWEGPFKTLYPAGHTDSKATYPLITIAPSEGVSAGPEQAVEALKNASRIMTDPRTYGPLIPGTRGLAQLSEDLYEAGTQQDRERMEKLVEWAGWPRQCLVGGRSQAADFCREAAKGAGEHRGAFEQIAALLETEVSLLTEAFPELNGEALAGVNTEELGARFVQASSLIDQVRATEMRIVATIETLSE